MTLPKLAAITIRPLITYSRTTMSSCDTRDALCSGTITQSTGPPTACWYREWTRQNDQEMTSFVWQTTELISTTFIRHRAYSRHIRCHWRWKCICFIE